MNRWVTNKYMWLGGLLIIGIILFGIGLFLFEGENPIALGTTLWYLNSTDREVLWVASDSSRFVTYYEGKERYILDYLPRLEGVGRGEWELAYMEEGSMIFRDGTEGGSKQVTVQYTPLRQNQYILFTYDVQDNE